MALHRSFFQSMEIRFGRKELVLTDTGTIKIGNMLAGTTAIPPPEIRPSGALVLAGIAEYDGEARHNMYETFNELPRLTVVSGAAVISVPSGADTNIGTGSGSTSQHKAG